jgi:hypothetical protein
MLSRAALIAFVAAAAGTVSLAAQTPPALEQERRDFAAWLAAAPLSPYGVVAQQPVGAGLLLGPDTADIPLAGAPAAWVREQSGAVWLEQGNARRPVPHAGLMAWHGYRLLAGGPRGRAILAVYGPIRHGRSPEYFPYAAGLTFTASLEPPQRRGRFRTLALDGTETEAEEAGFLQLTIAGHPVRLRAYRMGAIEDDEAELQVFFGDETNGKGSYPAGRFVTLEPAGPRRYRLDFNRARNPFCAYSTVFPCPAPWPGNRIPAPIEAGERYHAGP